MIYARRFTLTHGSVVEVFTQLGISPERCEVIVQLEPQGLSTTPYIYLSEDATHTNVGPVLFTEPASSATQDLPSATFRFFTDKDVVYLYNGDSSQDVTLAVALTAVP